jgi:20S proteasome alpha/beta subunit
MLACPQPLKHKRYPKDMTIALGLLTQTGIILAADSQESYGPDVKMQTGKIMLESTGSYDSDGALTTKTIAVTGAGDSGYLTVLKQRIHDASADCSDTKQMEEKLEEIVEDFYERHVAPFPPSQWGDFNVQLIVAASIQNVLGLWITYMNTVRRVETFAAVGLGEAWAASFLRGFIPQFADTRAGTAIAAYAIFLAKEHSKECGKDTHIVSIPRGDVVGIANAHAIRMMDDYFARYELATKSRHWIRLGAVPASRDPDSALQALDAEIAGIDPYPLPTWAKNQDEISPTSSETPQT